MGEGYHDPGLLRPGSHRVGGLTSDAALVEALAEVEDAWLQVLGEPAGVAADVSPAALLGTLEAAGNPVVPLLAALREAAGDQLHRGLTSQDSLDTALMLMTARVRRRMLADGEAVVRTLAGHAEAHRDSVMTGRTLTQAAVPITFGLKCAQWLLGVQDALDALARMPLPVQCGGAAGTLSLIAEVTDAEAAPARLAGLLGLDVPPLPWHTRRGPMTAVADGLVTLLDALGTIAADVALLSRPEIGELQEGTGGGSSTMPHKRNPVLSVLIRSAALQAPLLAAGVHTAAAQMVDERPDGAWHAQWPLYRDLLAVAVIATSQSRDLVEGLQVHDDVMRRRAQSYAADLLAERPVEQGHTSDPAAYLGRSGALVDTALATVAATVPALGVSRLTAATDGDVVILGAGLGTSAARLWAPVAHRLPGLQLLAVDLPGHGTSLVAGAQVTVAGLAEAVRQVARAVPGRRIWYAGVSLAGAVGLELAVHPGPVSGVIALASSARLGTPAGWRERADLVRRAGTAVMVAGSAQRWFAPGFSEVAPDVVGAMLDDLLAVDDESYARCCEALAEYDLRWELGSARIPVLLLPGAQDTVVPLAAAQADALRMPDGRAVAVAGVAHQPPVEAPDEVARLLGEFLEEAR